MTEEFIQVADITDIDINQSQSVNIDEVDILICNTDNGVFAVEDKCSHADIPLCGGQIIGNYITCPVHGAVFDLTVSAILSLSVVVLPSLDESLFDVKPSIIFA